MKSVEKAGLRRGAQGEAVTTRPSSGSERGLASRPDPRPGQPPGHRQHRQRGPDREELRDRAHAAGRPGGVRSLAHRGHRPQHRRLRGAASRSCRPWRRRWPTACWWRCSPRASGPPSGARCGPARRPRSCEQAAAAGPVAFVAGREDRGTHQRRAGSVRRSLVTIATDPRHPSLNLAQAVAIMAYETAGTPAAARPAAQATAAKRADPATAEQLEELFADWQPGALGHRLLQDPAVGERDALVSRDPPSRGARRPRVVAGPRDGHRGGALSRSGRSPVAGAPPAESGGRA